MIVKRMLYSVFNSDNDNPYKYRTCTFSSGENEHQEGLTVWERDGTAVREFSDRQITF